MFPSAELKTTEAFKKEFVFGFSSVFFCKSDGLDGFDIGSPDVSVGKPYMCYLMISVSIPQPSGSLEGLFAP